MDRVRFVVMLGKLNSTGLSYLCVCCSHCKKQGQDTDLQQQRHWLWWLNKMQLVCLHYQRFLVSY